MSELYTREERGEPSHQQNQQGDPPEEVLPPPPSMAEVLAQIERNRMDQMQILEAIARNTTPALGLVGGVTLHRAHGGLADFQRTNPPTFSSSEDPMQAEDWLHTIEKMLTIAQCTGAEKVFFASYLLDGAGSAWWDNFYAMRPDGDVKTWKRPTSPRT